MHLRSRGGRSPGGTWIALDEAWREGSRSVLRVDVAATTSLELRIAADVAPLIESLTWAGSIPEASSHDLNVSVPVQEQALDGFLGNIGVIPREWWGARPSAGCGGDGLKFRMAIHHTAGPESVNGDIGEALRLHMDGRGFCDLAYHFAVGVDGSLWEGRPLQFGGAHTLNENGGNIGIVSIGHASNADDARAVARDQDHGSTTSMPHFSKSLTLRVASDARVACAMPAICASSSAIGRPARLRSAQITAYARAASEPKNKMRPGNASRKIASATSSSAFRRLPAGSRRMPWSTSACVMLVV